MREQVEELLQLEVCMFLSFLFLGLFIFSFNFFIFAYYDQYCMLWFDVNIMKPTTNDHVNINK